MASPSFHSSPLLICASWFQSQRCGHWFSQHHGRSWGWGGRRRWRASWRLWGSDHAGAEGESSVYIMVLTMHCEMMENSECYKSKKNYKAARQGQWVHKVFQQCSTSTWDKKNHTRHRHAIQCQVCYQKSILLLHVYTAVLNICC